MKPDDVPEPSAEPTNRPAYPYSDAPPTQRGLGPPPTPTRPVWIKIIGIIMIVGGAGSASFAALSLPSQTFAYNAIKATSGPTDADAWKRWMLLTVALSLVLALWLLWSGIVLVRTRASAVGWLSWWSWAKIAYVLIASPIGAVYYMPDATMPPGVGAGFMLLPVVIMSLWSLALPVFLLIWFRRKRIRRDCDQWLVSRVKRNATPGE